MVTCEEHFRPARAFERADATFKEARENMMMTADGQLGLRIARAKLRPAVRERKYAKQPIRYEMNQVCAPTRCRFQSER
jgi:hypothetical protein